MRAFMALIFLAMCVLISVAYQAIQQEFRIRGMKAQLASITDQVKTKEEEILNAKLKFQQMNDELSPLLKEKEGQAKKLVELKNAKKDSESNLAKCKTDKGNWEKKKSEVTAALEKLKVDQQAEEQRVQQEIQNLQKQILDRDIKICAFVDEQKEEGRKLCEGKKAVQ